MPCTYCFRNNLSSSCRISDKSSRCLACIRRGRPCDGVLVASSLSRILDQQQKLEVEEEEASESLLSLHEQLTQLQSQLALAAGRLSRIRKIRAKVKERGDELFQRGMVELDREDGILPALSSHKSHLATDLRDMGVPNDVHWTALGLGDDFAEVGPLFPSGSGVVDQDAVGGTVQSPPEPSQGAS
ncbi:hypothetical protein F5Y17DRAFT_453887 [Xylariaceae sp. FL0594]|nr:hypothetical protein F5Y17DRAFT_453887 [Xylariaceae sp. FL0594]